MDIKKLALAVLVGYVVLQGTEYLVHGIWLKPIYDSLPDTFRRPDMIQAKMWVMWLGQFLMTCMFAYIYSLGVENKPWMGQGVRFGILIALLAVIPCTLSSYVVYRVPYTLAIQWMIAGSAQAVLLGIIVAGFVRKPARA